MIRLDSDGYCTVVVTCTACPYWSEIRLTMEESHRLAVHHESTYHEGTTQARHAAREWRARHAAKFVDNASQRA